MTKNERKMLFEMYQYSNIVPNVRNNMSMADLARHKYDSRELTSFFQDLMYALMMYSSPEEDKGDWKDKFCELLKSLNEYIETRKKEQWSSETDYSYEYAHGGW